MRKKIAYCVFILAAAAALVCSVAVFPDNAFRSAGIACAQDDWKAEFEDICFRTDDSLSLTNEELRRLVSRCDALKPRIEKLDETERKVFLQRLRMCRDLFAFVLESQEKK